MRLPRLWRGPCGCGSPPRGMKAGSCSPCAGRFASFLPPEAVRALFQTLGSLPNIAANWNMAPTQPAMVIRRLPANLRAPAGSAALGPSPAFAKSAKGPRPAPINARSETAATRPDVSKRPGPPPLHRAGGRVLRMAHPAGRQAALRHRPAGRHAACLRRRMGKLDAAGGARRCAALHPHHRRQRHHGHAPRAHAGDPGARRLARLVGRDGRRSHAPSCAPPARTCCNSGRLSSRQQRAQQRGRSAGPGGTIPEPRLPATHRKGENPA